MCANLRRIFVQLQICTFIHSGIFGACTTSFAIHSQNNICWQIQMYLIDKQQFQTLSCVHYTVFSVVELDLYIRALLLVQITVLENTMRTSRVHLVKTE